MVEKIRWENKDGRVHVSLEFNPEIIRTKLAIKNGGIAKTFVPGKDYKDYDEICSISMYEETRDGIRVWDEKKRAWFISHEGFRTGDSLWLRTPRLDKREEGIEYEY